MAKTKIYELTTNRWDGFLKWYVKGLRNKQEARALAKKAFGKAYWDAVGAVSYYDDYSSKWKKRALTKRQFLEETKIYREEEY